MDNKILELPVLKVKQPIGDFFIASIKARELVDISYADVRQLVKDQRDLGKYLGIQRIVSKKRILDIKKYIQSSDATFPTAVILAVDEKCAEYKKINENSGVLVLKPYYPENDGDGNESEIPFSRIAKVIDGQHRIAAFMDENNNWCFDSENIEFDINISIFIGADVSEQANIFATVNLAQTKVNKSLVYDLTELAKTPSPYKTCHNVAVVLDKEKTSPLYQRIKRLGTATEGRAREPLTQQSFVEALVPFISLDPDQDRRVMLEGEKLQRANLCELQKSPFRNLFIDGKDLDIAEILFNYFCAIRGKWPSSWDAIEKTGNLLPRSNAFKAFMKYLKDYVYLDLVKKEIGYIPSSAEFSKYFINIELKDEDFTTRNFAPGSGGQSTFYKMLRQEISLQDMLEK